MAPLTPEAAKMSGSTEDSSAMGGAAELVSVARRLVELLSSKGGGAAANRAPHGALVHSLRALLARRGDDGDDDAREAATASHHLLRASLASMVEQAPRGLEVPDQTYEAGPFAADAAAADADEPPPSPPETADYYRPQTRRVSPVDDGNPFPGCDVSAVQQRLRGEQPGGAAEPDARSRPRAIAVTPNAHVEVPRARCGRCVRAAQAAVESGGEVVGLVGRQGGVEEHDQRRRSTSSRSCSRLESPLRNYHPPPPPPDRALAAPPACAARMRARSRVRVARGSARAHALHARGCASHAAHEVRIIASGPLAGQFGAFARADLAAPLPPGYMLPFAGAVVAVGRRAFEVCRDASTRGSSLSTTEK